MAETRIYVVLQNGGTPARRLVEATSAAQAVRHCAQEQYQAAAASPKDIANLMAEGVRLEKITHIQTDKQTTT